MSPNLEKPNSEPEQISLDLRTDEQTLAEARTKKLEDLTDREMGLLRVANSIENREDKKDTIGGQKIH
ncbi:MAG TPA: hypothetical protein VJB95_02385 [Candidatus Paceibacterota bacterium]